MKAHTLKQIEKLGNAILFFGEKIVPLCKTTLFKLVYLLDDFSITRHGVPFFSLDYKLWREGPINVGLYEELDHPLLLDSFISVEQDNLGTRVIGKRLFSDDEFSEVEIDLLTEVFTLQKNKSSKELSEIIKRQSAAWYIAAHENDLLDSFNDRSIDTTIPVDLALLIKNDARKIAIYKEDTENQEFFDFLKVAL